MRFGLLGPLRAWEEGRELPIGSGRERALLARLLLHAGEVVSRDRLIDDLWGERPPATATKVLQGYVGKLRRALPPDSIATQGLGYVLRPAETDAGEFEQLLEAARGQETREAAGTLREALALWRGRALADVEYEPWAQPEAARLEELRLVALEERIEADLRLGEASRVVPELEALVKEHPLRERSRGQLMLALYRAGRQPEALGLYSDLRRSLVDELGVEPGKAVRELHQAILRQDAGLDLQLTAERAAERESKRSVFVGRESELAELLAALEQSLVGSGRLFLLVGEPGIGKSRLAEEVIRHGAARGMDVLVGRCWEAGGAPAYWPWVQSLRSHVRDTAPELLQAHLGSGAAVVAQILPELHEAFPNLPDPAPVDADSARFRLFDAVADFLRRASDERPMLLILDDLHAADAPSLLLLQFVARELGSLRMVVIGTARDVDPVPGRLLTATLSGLSREPVTSRLSLSGLTEEDVAAYLEEFVSDLSPELASALYEQTEGHPFFLSETVRLLDVEGGAVRDAAIPQSIRDVIARRLDHLSGECNELLVLASVLGREFALTALMRVSELDEDELLGWLDEAMAARLVSEVPDTTDRLRFAHILIRDALYNGLSAARRVRLHRRVLAALETLYADDPSPHLAELAQHARRANEFRRAVDYAHLAADRAQTLLAYEEAARLYRVALDCLELAGGGDELRAELLLSIGEAEEMSDRRAAQDAFLEAATVARRLGETRILARAALGYGGRIPWARAGDDDRLVPLLEEGLSGLTGADTELRARLLARLAGALRDEHSRDRRDELSAKAVELGRRSLDPDVLAFTLDGRAAAISAPDTLETFVELTTELIELGERTGDPRWFMHGHASRFVARVMLGDLDGARSDLAAHNRLVDEQRQPGVEVFHVRAAQAMLALAEGRLDEAEDLLREAIEIGERAQPEMAFPVYAVQRYTFCDFRARLEEVEPAIRDLVATYPARRAFQCVLAHLYARLGRAGEARQFLGELSSDGFSALPFDQEWLYAMSLIAETCVLLQDGDTAADIYALLAPWAALNAADPHEGFRGSVARYLGQLAATSAQWDDAERHFEAALIANTNMGATAWVALTQLDFARMLLARDGPRDRERARELAAAALATCRELGLEGYAPEAELAAGHR